MTQLPADFALTEPLKQWARLHGYTRIEDRFEYFCDWARSRAVEYADWPAAFRNSVRGDWAHFNGPNGRPIAKSEQEWLAEGRERGINPKPGESTRDFIRRVQQALPQ